MCSWLLSWETSCLTCLQDRRGSVHFELHELNQFHLVGTSLVICATRHFLDCGSHNTTECICAHTYNKTSYRSCYLFCYHIKSQHTTHKTPHKHTVISRATGCLRVFNAISLWENFVDQSCCVVRGEYKVVELVLVLFHLKQAGIVCSLIWYQEFDERDLHGLSLFFFHFLHEGPPAFEEQAQWVGSRCSKLFPIALMATRPWKLIHIVDWNQHRESSKLVVWQPTSTHKAQFYHRIACKVGRRPK